MMTWRKKRKESRDKQELVKTISVMFVPYTRGGELAKRLRTAEEELGRQTGIKIKVVEKTGTRLVDLLHKSDPWQGQDCQRPGCLIGTTKTKTGKGLSQDCTKRNIVYETWCRKCEKMEEKKILDTIEEEEEQKKAMKKIRLFKYVGESSRSAYERGLEHARDLEELKKDSHMLKHYFSMHEGEKVEDMDFGMRIVKAHKTAFNRQISESVIIQTEKKQHVILNSKSEYNRCALPRLTAKMGEESFSKLEKSKREEKEAEKELEKKIRAVKVLRSQSRRQEPSPSEQPAEKRRKLSKEEYRRVLQEKKEAKKRDVEEEDNDKYYRIFNDSKLNNLKRRKIELEEGKRENEDEEEEEDKLNWTQEEWTRRLMRRQKRLEKEEEERQKRISKAKRMEQSWELLRLCHEMMEEEGYHWKKSKERREQEKKNEDERQARLELAAEKRAKTLEKLETHKIQQKITDKLQELPQNRRILAERELERERKITLKEAREELWKKWRQSKGKRKDNPKLTTKSTKEDLEEKLTLD